MQGLGLRFRNFGFDFFCGFKGCIGPYSLNPQAVGVPLARARPHDLLLPRLSDGALEIWCLGLRDKGLGARV